jgi:hypothetical protein
MKYAVKVMLSVDDWIYITEDTGGNCWDLKPVLFDNHKEAEKFVDKLRLKDSRRSVKVVEYELEEAND